MLISRYRRLKNKVISRQHCFCLTHVHVSHVVKVLQKTSSGGAVVAREGEGEGEGGDRS